MSIDGSDLSAANCASTLYLLPDSTLEWIWRRVRPDDSRSLYVFIEYLKPASSSSANITLIAKLVR